MKRRHDRPQNMTMLNFPGIVTMAMPEAAGMRLA
jgi:hypothetical protein